MAENGAPDQAQQEMPAGGPPAEQQKSRGPLLIIIAIILLLLIIVAAVLYIFIFRTDDRAVVAANPEEAKFYEQYNIRKQESLDQLKGGEEPVFSSTYSYQINLEGGKNILSFAFRARLQDEQANLYLNGIRPSIDDAVFSLLKGVKPGDLRNRAGIDLIKRDVYKLMNSMFSQKFIESSDLKDRTPVKEILIVELFIQ